MLGAQLKEENKIFHKSLPASKAVIRRAKIKIDETIFDTTFTKMQLANDPLAITLKPVCTKDIRHVIFILLLIFIRYLTWMLSQKKFLEHFS